MSSILAIDPEILLIGLAMPLGVALIVGMAALLWRKRNGNGERHVEERHVEEVPEKLADAAARADAKIARLERMVFLMLSIVSSRADDVFVDKLEELWRLQREMEIEKLKKLAAGEGR